MKQLLFMVATHLGLIFTHGGDKPFIGYNVYRIVLVVIVLLFFFLLLLFYVGIFDLVHNVEAIFHLRWIEA